VKVLAIAQVGLVRLVRDRGNLFSMFVLPVLLTLLLGSQFGDRDEPRVGIHGPPALVERVAAQLDGMEVERVADHETLRDDALSGRLALGVSVPADAERRLRAGEPVRAVTYVRENGAGTALAPVVAGALDEALLVPWIEGQGGDPAAAGGPRTEVVMRESGGATVVASERFGPSAAQQLVLIVFLTSLLSASTMVQNRALGVTRRMLATPSSLATIVAGEAAARWAVALMQGLYVIVATTLLFGVDWGNVGLTALILLTFTAVGAGAGMLLGALVDDEMVVVGVSLLLGLTIGALGGAMVPRDLFGPGLADFAGAIPHAWALDGLEAIRAGDGFGEVAGPALALAAMAAALLALASWRLLAKLSRA